MTEKLQEGCTVQPQTKEELAAIIYKTCQKKGWDCDLNFIDTSKITDMSYLFAGDENDGFRLSNFCGNISNWDTSNVTDMEGMFWGARSFNQPLNNWDVSNVNVMEDMFNQAHSFNQPLDNWDTSHVTNMTSMFAFAQSFNQPLDNWNTSNVDEMTAMFHWADDFKSELPKFKNYKGTKEELLNELGLPSDFKPEIKKNQEPEKPHKKGMSR